MNDSISTERLTREDEMGVSVHVQFLLDLRPCVKLMEEGGAKELCKAAATATVHVGGVKRVSIEGNIGKNNN